MNHVREKMMEVIFFLSACISVLSVFLICFFLFSNGFPAINAIGWDKFIFGNIWKPSNHIYGIFPMIIGSFYITFGALIMGGPIGILTAVFMVHFCPSKLYKLLKTSINLMAGIPSVVYGFFGLVVLVPLIRNHFGGFGMSILTASILLSLMILPTIINISESAIRSVPKFYYEGGVALGASHEHSIFFIVLPAAKRGILAAVILGIGRAIGETMAVIMVAGNQAIFPSSWLSGIRTMTTNIVMEMGYSSGLHREALIGTAVVLFIFILIINISFSLLSKEV